MDSPTSDKNSAIIEWSRNVSINANVIEGEVENLCRIVDKDTVIALVCCLCRDVILLVDSRRASKLFENIDRAEVRNMIDAMMVCTICGDHTTMNEDESPISDANVSMTVGQMKNTTVYKHLDVVVRKVNIVKSMRNKNEVMLSFIHDFEPEFGNVRMLRALYKDTDPSKFGRWSGLVSRP